MGDNVTADDCIASEERNHESGDQIPSEDILRLDSVYKALAHPRQRYVCYLLLEDTEWVMATLATKIAAWENDISECAVTAQQQNRVEISLYHVHGPKLADRDIIIFDEEDRKISAGENAEHVTAALEGIGATLDSL